jgi:hypothetical protein
MCTHALASGSVHGVNIRERVDRAMQSDTPDHLGIKGLEAPSLHCVGHEVTDDNQRFVAAEVQMAEEIHRSAQR